MNAIDNNAYIPSGMRVLAEQVEYIERNAECSEETAALVVLAKQVKDVAFHVNRLVSVVAEWEENE